MQEACSRGHPLTPDNVYFEKQSDRKALQRRCRECRRVKNANYRLVHPSEPPAITALWDRASAAMNRAEDAKAWTRRGSRDRREGMAECYAILAELRSLGVIEGKAPPKPSSTGRERPHVFLNSRWHKELHIRYHG